MTESNASPSTAAIRIIVNGQAIVMTSKHVTGAEIKAAAIAVGVPIQADFVLSEVRPSGEQKIVPDDHQVSLKDGDEFWAIPGDDNS
ncbi:multiubiquitin domain-containing protein [Nocardioides terrisoli]|uniref:multiubiquitin domain-containing protein n=1 Tax=Nocardioides terrisoli TaxID=3388267 RepID=UPI00287BA8F5|nr:multiubiquitin domain-containing protein [Nocardioides marmorisolisilvae]